MLSERAKNIEESATLAVSAKIAQFKKQGIDVVGFGAGEPDFDTPENIKKAAIKAIEEGFTKYTPVPGIDELREAIAQKFRKENRIEYSKNQIMASNGAKQILYEIMLALLNKGGEVIISRPYWVSYVEQVKLADGVPVICETENFKIRADLIKEKITDKTKIIILNYPNNPTGMSCGRKELEKIADIAAEKNVYVVSDECYEKFLYDGNEFTSIASLNEEIKNLTLTVNSVSKTYSMTGWRLGYCGGPEEIIKSMIKIQSQTTSNPCCISQKAALEALTGPQDSVKKMIEEFTKRREFMVRRLKEMGLDCIKPEGAFYAFPSIESSGMKSLEFCSKLLEKEKAAVVPGIAFGADDNVRLSYAASMDTIKNGLERIERFVKSL